MFMGYEYGDNSIDAYSGQVYTDGKENFMTEMISAFDSRKNKEWEKSKTDGIPLPIQRTYQDSLFSTLYSDKDTLLDLYGSLHPDDLQVTKEQIKLITLSNTLVVRRYNDVAFAVGDRLIILTEHQSTVNQNMPLRMLFYVAGEYEKLLGGMQADLYGYRRIRLPKPEFYIVYTGREPQKIEDKLRLSDAFETKGCDLSLDLCVKVITKADAGSTLQGYFELIQFMKSNLQDGHISTDSLEEFIIKFSGSKLFKQFLLRMEREEIVKMLNTEYNYEVERQVLLEEGREEGREEPRAAPRNEDAMSIAQRLKDENFPREMISKITGLSFKEIDVLR